MEIASCSILYTLGFWNNTVTPAINNNLCLPPKSNLCSLPSFSPTFPRNFNSPGKNLQFNGFTAFSTSSSAQNQNPSLELAVLLEVDGVLMDAYRVGNRQAFNLGAADEVIICLLRKKDLNFSKARPRLRKVGRTGLFGSCKEKCW
ncbi:hypothetical protein V6N13_015690 [Hibiscus sabdariffa]